MKYIISIPYNQLAAGALCTPKALAGFLQHLAAAYHRHSHQPTNSSISNRTAQLMMNEESLRDLGAMEFMGAKVTIS